MAVSKSAQEQDIIDALEKAAPAHAIDIVDVSVEGAKTAPIVCIRIDHADEDAEPITLDEVTAQGGWINEAVDELDPFPGAYTLEISSPGMSRPLRRPHDFERFAGETVQIKLDRAEGRKRWTGVLKGFEDGAATIDTDEGEQRFPLDEIAKCTIKPDFDTAGKKRGGKN